MLLHRDHGFIPSRIEQLHVVNLQFDLQNLIEVQHGFVRDADLEILIDRPCDLPSRGKPFSFLRSLILNEDSSFEISVNDLLEITRYL